MREVSSIQSEGDKAYDQSCTNSPEPLRSCLIIYMDMEISDTFKNPAIRINKRNLCFRGKGFGLFNTHNIRAIHKL